MKNEILKCLYVIIALLLINILVVITTNGSVKKEETKTDDTEENTEYDVSMFTSIRDFLILSNLSRFYLVIFIKI